MAGKNAKTEKTTYTDRNECYRFEGYGMRSAYDPELRKTRLEVRVVFAVREGVALLGEGAMKIMKRNQGWIEEKIRAVAEVLEGEGWEKSGKRHWRQGNIEVEDPRGRDWLTLGDKPRVFRFDAEEIVENRVARWRDITWLYFSRPPVHNLTDEEKKAMVRRMTRSLDRILKRAK